MSRNGSGQYIPPASSWNPAVDGNSATTADFNALLTDLSNALTQSVSKDGQTAMTGNLPMGGNKLTGLSAGSVAGDSLRFEQLFSQGTESDLASAATVDIGGQFTNFLRITGTTAISSFGTNYNGPKFLRFAGALQLTHNATTLILPGAANITTQAGDCAIVRPVGNPATGWQVVSYQKSSGAPIGSAAAGPLASSGITGAAASGANSDITSLSGLTSTLAEVRQIQPISASIASNAITISASSLSLEFRSTTLGSGAVSLVKGTPSNLVIASTDSFGLVTAAGNQRIAILAINNAGTIELAAASLAGGVNLDETGLITTVTAATTGGQIKSTTARTNVAYRVIGFVDATFTTAVGWGSLSLVQGQGGQAIAAMQSLGYGQTWQNVTGSRVSGTTYYNTTGKPIAVCATSSTGGLRLDGSINGAAVITSNMQGSGSAQASLTLIVPPGSSYSITNTGSFSNWSELR